MDGQAEGRVTRARNEDGGPITAPQGKGRHWGGSWGQVTRALCPRPRSGRGDAPAPPPLGHTGDTEGRTFPGCRKTCTENCNPPEPCKKIREALCLPAGDVTQRCRRTGPDAAAIAAATSGVPRARARTRRGRAWEHACAARLTRSSRRAQREAVPEVLTEFACLEGY